MTFLKAVLGLVEFINREEVGPGGWEDGAYGGEGAYGGYRSYEDHQAYRGGMGARSYSTGAVASTPAAGGPSMGEMQIGGIRLQVATGDITQESTDALVNSTNSKIDLSMGRSPQL